MNLLFDLILLSLVNAFQKFVSLADKQGVKPGYNKRTTSMECLAFDSLHNQAGLRYEEPETEKEDAFFDGGPDW